MSQFSFQKLDVAHAEKRVSEINLFLNDFIHRAQLELGIEIKSQYQSAEKITALYLAKLHNDVKRFVPKRINRYKIGALTELSIIKVQPLYVENSSMNRKINAQFAFFCCISIISEHFLYVNDFEHVSSNLNIQEVFEKSKNQRLLWLESKNLNSFPVFLSGLSLFTLFELYNQRFQALPL